MGRGKNQSEREILNREFDDLQLFLWETHMGWEMSESSQMFIRKKIEQVLEGDDARKIFSGWKSWSDKTRIRVRNAEIMDDYFRLLDDGTTHEEIRERLAPKFNLSPEGIKKVHDRWD